MSALERPTRPTLVTDSPLRAGLWVAPQPEGFPLSDPELRALREVAPARHFGRGGRVYRPGDPAEGFYLVLEGRVKLSAPTPGGERVLALCGPGDLFGLNRCAGEPTHPLEAVSLAAQTCVLAISCAALRAALQTEGVLASRLIGLLSQRVGALEEQLEVVRLPAQARLARTLLALTRRLGVEVASEVYEVALELRHDEIAALAGTGRVSVTQALSAWRAVGVVSGTRGRYQVDAARLEALCELLEAGALE